MKITESGQDSPTGGGSREAFMNLTPGVDNTTDPAARTDDSRYRNPTPDPGGRIPQGYGGAGLTTTWRGKADAAMEVLVQGNDPFWADHLRNLVGDPDSTSAPNGRNNAIGSVFAAWHSAGRIEPVGTTQSKNPKRKGGLVRTWRGVL